MEYLLEHGADVNRGVKSSSLHYAACFGRPNIVKLLLQYGADPELRDEDGHTPLEKAQERGDEWHRQVIEILENPSTKRGKGGRRDEGGRGEGGRSSRSWRTPVRREGREEGGMRGGGGKGGRGEGGRSSRSWRSWRSWRTGGAGGWVGGWSDVMEFVAFKFCSIRDAVECTRHVMISYTFTLCIRYCV